MTREQWLEKATRYLRLTVFKQAGHTVPSVRVSCGFPGGPGDRRKTLGEHWHPRVTSDNKSQIFITPTVRDSQLVLAILTHELVHAIVPDNGHGREFRRIAKSIGLTGPMRSTVAGPELEELLARIVLRLGFYPHAEITTSGGKKQTTRLNKVSCMTCGYTVRVTRRWLNQSGPPICPCNGYTMQQEQDDA